MRKANTIKLARIQAGKSQLEAAAESGINQTQISLIERDLKQPTPSQLSALARVYGVSESELRKISKALKMPESEIFTDWESTKNSYQAEGC